MDIFVKPGRRTLTEHTKLGNSVIAFDGRSGWISGPDKPVPVLAVPSGDDLDGLKLDADLSIPTDIKRSLTDWRAGFAPATIDDRDVVVIQGTMAGHQPVKLYFEKESGLLVRQLRYANTVVGIVPTQVDYSDYRPVAGVKVPFKVTVTWTDGQAHIELTDVQPNVPIADAAFARPAPPVTPTSVLGAKP